MNLQESSSQDSQHLNEKQHHYSTASLPPYYELQVDKRTGVDFDQPQEKLTIQKKIFAENQTATKLPSVFTNSYQRYPSTDVKNLHDGIPLSELSASPSYLGNSSFSSPKEKRQYSFPTSTHSNENTSQSQAFYNSFAPMPKHHSHQERNISTFPYSQTNSEPNPAFVVDEISEKSLVKTNFRKLDDDRADKYGDGARMQPDAALPGKEDFDKFSSASPSVLSHSPQKQKNEELSLNRFPVSTILPDIKNKSRQPELWKSKSDESSTADDVSEPECSAKSDFNSEKGLPAYKEEEDEEEEEQLNNQETCLEEGKYKFRYKMWKGDSSIKCESADLDFATFL